MRVIGASRQLYRMPGRACSGDDNSKASCCTTSNGSNKVHDQVSQYYGTELKSTKDLKTSACTATGRPSASIRALLKAVPDEVLAKFYGCGAPLPLGINGCVTLLSRPRSSCQRGTFRSLKFSMKSTRAP